MLIRLNSIIQEVKVLVMNLSFVSLNAYVPYLAQCTSVPQIKN